jgi:hypothetical protein
VACHGDGFRPPALLSPQLPLNRSRLGPSLGGRTCCGGGGRRSPPVARDCGHCTGTRALALPPLPSSTPRPAPRFPDPPPDTIPDPLKARRREARKQEILLGGPGSRGESKNKGSGRCQQRGGEPDSDEEDGPTSLRRLALPSPALALPCASCCCRCRWRGRAGESPVDSQA